MDLLSLEVFNLIPKLFWKTVSLNKKDFLKCAFLLTNTKLLYIAHTLHAASITFQ